MVPLTPFFKNAHFPNINGGPLGSFMTSPGSTLQAIEPRPAAPRPSRTTGRSCRGFAAVKPRRIRPWCFEVCNTCVNLAVYFTLLTCLLTSLLIKLSCITIYILYNKHNIHVSLCVIYVSIHGVIGFVLSICTIYIKYDTKMAIHLKPKVDVYSVCHI